MEYLILHTGEIEEKLILDELNQKHLPYKVVSEPIQKEAIIPVGNIEFVEKCLGKQMKPIEIPEYLQLPDLLLRDYFITDYEHLPKDKEYFVKVIDKIKSFANRVHLNWGVEPLKATKYSVSELFDIQAEYRVNVIHNKIDSVSYYAGDPTVFPDVSKINKIKGLIYLNDSNLKSYTIDLMVGPKGTALIEIHNFVSVGLYSTINSNLSLAYKEGIEYLLKH